MTEKTTRGPTAKELKELAKEAKRHTGRAALRTINVRELIEALQEQDPEALVVFTSSYGDYGNTPQAHPLTGEIKEVKLEESAYSHSGWAIQRERDTDDEPDEPTVPFLVIQ